MIGGRYSQSGSSSPIVTMVQAAEPVMRKDTTRSHGANSPDRCSLPQPEVRAVLVVVADILIEQPFQMTFVDCNDVIQQVSSTALHPTFRDTVLPRAFERGPYRPDLQRSNGCPDFQPVFRIPVEDQIPGSHPERKRFPQLLDNPQTRWMPCDVEVQDASPIVGDYEKAVEHSESDRRNGEEIHSCNGFSVVAQKGKPSPGWLRIPRRSFHPAGDRSFRDIKTDHEQLAVDARCAPSRILGHHPEDQLPNFLRGLSSPDRLADFGNQLPVQPEPDPVPPDHRFRCDNDESLFPF